MRKQDEDLNVKPEALLWLDFETTGTDRDDSLPLEVGMECTDVLGEHSHGSLHRIISCLLYTSPSPRDGLLSRMPSSA